MFPNFEKIIEEEIIKFINSCEKSIENLNYQDIKLSKTIYITKNKYLYLIGVEGFNNFINDYNECCEKIGVGKFTNEWKNGAKIPLTNKIVNQLKYKIPNIINIEEIILDMPDKLYLSHERYRKDEGYRELHKKKMREYMREKIKNTRQERKNNN